MTDPQIILGAVSALVLVLILELCFRERARAKRDAAVTWRCLQTLRQLGYVVSAEEVARAYRDGLRAKARAPKQDWQRRGLLAAHKPDNDERAYGL